MKQNDITELRSVMGTCSSTCRMVWWRGLAVCNRNTERFPPAALTETALFETTFPWTSHGPQPCYCFILFPLLLFILFPFKVSPCLSNAADYWTLEGGGGGGWGKKQTWSHRLNLKPLLQSFFRSSVMLQKCKTDFGCKQLLLKRSTAVNYIIHGLLIIKRMCLGRIVWPCFLCSEITACKKMHKVVQKLHKTQHCLKSERVSPRWMCKQLAPVNTLVNGCILANSLFSSTPCFALQFSAFLPLFHPPKQACLLLKQTSLRFHGNKHCSLA